MTIQLDFAGYALRLDRRYDPDTHMWVLDVADAWVRVGLDALTADTYGALAQLALAPEGTRVARGEPFGSLEAAKFVGPLIAPVSGVLETVNTPVLMDPELVLRDPYGDGWLAEFTEVGPAPELVDSEQARTWFAHEVADYREKGLVAE